MDKCRKLLLHADGGTAAPDITGDGIDIFDMDHACVFKDEATARKREGTENEQPERAPQAG